MEVLCKPLYDFIVKVPEEIVETVREFVRVFKNPRFISLSAWLPKFKSKE